MEPKTMRWAGLAMGITLGLVGAEQAAAQLSITAVGKFNFNNAAPTGLSGITYAGGNQYYAVEDSGARLHALTIDLNLTTGAVVNALAGSVIQLGGSDLEGTAYNAANNSVYVSDETGPAIREYNLAGTQIGTVTVPPIYNNIRTNLSLESLALQAGRQSLWTANEEALSVDGVTSTTSSGTTVRLQKFDSNLNPAGQWAYVTNTTHSSFPSDSSEQTGVSDMLVLPNGKVLVLERRADVFLDGLTPSVRFDNFIYEVDFTGATDVSGIADLSGGGFTAVTKTLLWHSPWFSGSDRNNFEGMTLGPQLNNGDYAILLISDGDDISSPLGTIGVGESLYALRLSGAIPEPTSLALFATGACLLLVRRRCDGRAS